MGKYKGFGTMTLEVSKMFEAADDDDAFKQLVNKFNTYGIKSIIIKVEMENGELHELDIHDHELEWNLNSVEELEREKTDKQAV